MDNYYLHSIHLQKNPPKTKKKPKTPKNSPKATLRPHWHLSAIISALRELR